MLVTRDIINKQLSFIDYPDNTPYQYGELSSLVDAYKNLLSKKYCAIKGQSVLLGFQAGKTQIALVFACAELSLSIVIVDYGRSDKFEGEYYDPKTTILLPIDFFIIPEPNETAKFRFFQQVCNTTIILENEELDYTPNTSLDCAPDSILVKCTSSGTTGTPKRIEHTHQFIFELVKRNSKMFSGKVGQAFNLSHGSSLATYFLPTLVSPGVTEYINFLTPSTKELLSVYSLDHLMLPYPFLVEEFIDHYAASTHTGITLYTLTYIREEWKSFVNNKKIKDILSFFGSNETSGPTLLNRLSSPNFDNQMYRKIDDFYTFDIENHELFVTLPVYDKRIGTNDVFKVTDDVYYHMGRNDLLRINGVFFTSEIYQDYLSSVLCGQMVFDFINNKIYLAVWENVENLNEKVEEVSNMLKSNSNGAHYISAYRVLNSDDFLSGIKLDHELLREYFRRNVQ